MTDSTNAQTKQSLGGIARAEALTPQRRKSIASVAAKARWALRHNSSAPVIGDLANNTSNTHPVTITIGPMDAKRKRDLIRGRAKQKRWRARHPNAIVQDDARRAVVRAAVARYRAKQAKKAEKGVKMK